MVCAGVCTLSTLYRERWVGSQLTFSLVSYWSPWAGLGETSTVGPASTKPHLCGPKSDKAWWWWRSPSAPCVHQIQIPGVNSFAFFYSLAKCIEFTAVRLQCIGVRDLRMACSPWHWDAGQRGCSRLAAGRGDGYCRTGPLSQAWRLAPFPTCRKTAVTLEWPLNVVNENGRPECLAALGCQGLSSRTSPGAKGELGSKFLIVYQPRAANSDILPQWEFS